MPQNGVPSFAELLAGTRRSAVHLEMRDAYGVGDEADEFEQFKRTSHVDLDPRAPYGRLSAVAW